MAMTGDAAVRHTGNAGILIRVGEELLGIDIFCRDQKGLYEDTPPQEREYLLGLIEKKELCTLVFTHEHGDHFCLEDVLEGLKKNRELRIISTEKVAEKIREKSQEGILTAIAPEETSLREAELSSEKLRLFLFNSPHMGDQFTHVQNLVCLLEAAGQKLLIPGDARPDGELFSRVAGWSPVLDWLIGPFPLVGLPSSRKKIREVLTVRHVLALHLPRPDRDVHGWRESAERVCRRAEDGLPMPLFGDAPGRTYAL